MVALRCYRRGGSVDWDGDGAGGGPAIGLEEKVPRTASRVALGEGGGGGGARSMSATDLVAFGWGRRRTRGGGSSPRVSAAARGR